jgi:hypothetical protein
MSRWFFVSTAFVLESTTDGKSDGLPPLLCSRLFGSFAVTSKMSGVRTAVLYFTLLYIASTHITSLHFISLQRPNIK